jgi:class 3 adenylate cyclase/tetratricopeptide (TPR) repeat protein
MKFCGQCGAKLAPLCPHCGTENPPGFKFCGECGSALGAPPPESPTPAPEAPRHTAQAQSYTPPHLAAQVFQSKSALEGERKQVTVLFCDLVGSTSLAERLGPETMHLLLNRFFELALSEVHRYEGTINQFLGDGFMALFGAPIAHEDHARRAALAAMGLQKLLAEHHDELGGRGGVELKVRMVVGGIGDQLRRDYTAIGDTTNLAARLQQLAAPGEILVSEDTSRFLQGSARLEPLPAVHVKGKEALVRAFRLLGVGLLQPEGTVLAGVARSPLVGRQREMAVLEDLWARSAAGEGQVVGIAAEAGAGKSRLAYELRQRLWEQPVLYLSGRCLSYASGVPYLPILYLLRNAWEIGETDEPAAVAAKIARGLRRAEMEPEEALPYLLHLFGMREGTEKLADLSAQAIQTRTLRLLRQMILNASRRLLVVVEIEDIQWVDRTSEEFLSFLAEGLFAARILFIATYRSGYRPPWLEKSYATQIALARLTDVESREVIRSMLEAAPAEELVSAILAKAEGNPFFLEELSRSLLENPGIAVPDTIQGVIMARVDRLPEDHKRLLQTASVLGRELPLNLLSAVLDQAGQADQGEGLTRLLADLKRWEFLYEEPTAEEPRYLFKHALTQEAVYQTLLTSRRRALHGAAGRAFETLYSSRPEDVFDSLAYHYSEAAEEEKAIRYLVLSAEQAARRYAHAEAAQALREALGHCERLPQPEVVRRRMDMILRLAESLLPLARFHETLELFLAERDLLDLLEDPSLTGRFYFWLAHTYSYLGDQEAAAGNARLAIAAARQSGDAVTEGRAWYVLCRDNFWAGRFSEGIEQGRQAVALLEQSADVWWQGQAYCVTGFHHYVLGQFREAFDMMAKAEALWRALQDPRLDPSWSTGYFHASLGEWELGIEECKGGLERTQDPLNTAAALGFLGYAYLAQGDLARAGEALEESVRRLRQAGMQQLLGWFSAFLAEARLLAGRPEEARDLAGEALAVTEGVHFRYGSGMVQRALGRIARAAGSPAEADGWFRQALESFHAIQAPFEVARTQIELALLAGAGSPEAARQLGEARRTFAELGVPYYVREAERLAEEMAAPALPEEASGPNIR